MQREKVKGEGRCWVRGCLKGSITTTARGSLSGLPSLAAGQSRSGIKESPTDGRHSASPRILPPERGLTSAIVWGRVLIYWEIDNSELHTTAVTGLLALSLVLNRLPHICSVNTTGPTVRTAHPPSHSQQKFPLNCFVKAFVLNDILKLHFQLFKNVKSKNSSKQNNSGVTFFYIFRVLLSDLTLGASLIRGLSLCLIEPETMQWAQVCMCVVLS